MSNADEYKKGLHYEKTDLLCFEPAYIQPASRG
jgi:hypothetical protein